MQITKENLNLLPEKERDYVNSLLDYDLEEAINKEEKHGYKSIHDNTKWMVIDESIIDYYMKRNKPVMTAPIKVTMNEKIENIDDFKRLGINIQSKKSMFEQIRTI